MNDKLPIDVRRLRSEGPKYLKQKAADLKLAIQLLGTMPELFKELILLPMAYIIKQNLGDKPTDVSMASMMSASALKLMEEKLNEFLHGNAPESVSEDDVDQDGSAEDIAKVYSAGAEKVLKKFIDEFKAMYSDENLMKIDPEKLDSYLAEYMEFYESKSNAQAEAQSAVEVQQVDEESEDGSDETEEQEEADDDDDVEDMDED